ncbi:MAG TPA: flavodoxin [Firmicutes bacterium]|nr:flavodoxin [Bacillota bacterium]
MCVAIVYWSGTGNTEAMAKEIAKGVQEKGAECKLFMADEFNETMMDDYQAIAFGCPSMGEEVLEETEFEPMFRRCEPLLNGRKIALFGSYGWGDGEWMRNWEDEVREKGASLVADSVICCEEPDEEACSACNDLGRALAS